MASFAPSLSDPPGTSSILDAVQWIEGTLLGTIATTIAVIAIACVGAMMLTGRVNLRHGATTIFGCFILFGATSIVAGLRSAVSGEVPQLAVVVDPSPPIMVPPTDPMRSADPYAGASLRRP